MKENLEKRVEELKMIIEKSRTNHERLLGHLQEAEYQLDTFVQANTKPAAEPKAKKATKVKKTPKAKAPVKDKKAA